MIWALEDLVEAKMIEGHVPDVAWLKDVKFKIPREILRKNHCSEEKRNLRLELADGEFLFENSSFTGKEKTEIVSSLRALRMFTETSPLSSKMPFSYQVVPPSLRSMIARAIGKRRNRDMHRWAAFPSFPLDLSSDALSDILSVPYNKLRPTPVLLTHDIDSPEGLRNLPLFMREEEMVGATSTSFVVPCGWEIDHGLLSDVSHRGHEIGIHGFNHSNKTAFMREQEINGRIDKMRDFIGKYDVIGYRSPSLLRTKKLLRALARGFMYDASIPTSGGLFPTPNNGCASARPFYVEGILEIPLSMPRDGTLLFLGFAADEIGDIWLECADLISRSGGVVVLLTHCEKRFSGNRGMLDLYRRTLRKLAIDERFSFSTPREVIKTLNEGLHP